MTTSFVSETIDQEFSLADMEELNGGTFGAGVLVGALAATYLSGFIGAQKHDMPGSPKSSFGWGKKKDKEAESESDDTENTSNGQLPVPGGGDPGVCY